MRKDLEDWARTAGLSIVFPPRVFPVNSVNAMRGCLLLESDGKQVPFARAVFEAYWSEDEDISQDAVLARICDRIEVDSRYLLDGIGEQKIKDKLRANAEELIRRGGLRLPDTMFVGTDMYFGNDRLALVRDAVQRLRGSVIP
jgi:2-hydroxychromene-2-carboxylate isomerase